jgi:hypothetical protein
MRNVLLFLFLIDWFVAWLEDPYIEKLCRLQAAPRQMAVANDKIQISLCSNFGYA